MDGSMRPRMDQSLPRNGGTARGQHMAQSTKQPLNHPVVRCRVAQRPASKPSRAPPRTCEQLWRELCECMRHAIAWGCGSFRSHWMQGSNRGGARNLALFGAEFRDEKSRPQALPQPESDSSSFSSHPTRTSPRGSWSRIRLADDLNQWRP